MSDIDEVLIREFDEPPEPTEEELLALELGLTLEEYRFQQQEWAATLTKQIKQARWQLTQSFSQCFGAPSQAKFRYASWTHTFKCLTEPEYKQQVDQLWTKLQVTFPLRIGSTLQDKYHQLHFINACLLVHLAPSTALRNKPFNQPSYIEVNENESARLEEKAAVYNKLAALLPVELPTRAAEPMKTASPTNTEVIELLHEVLVKLDTLQAQLEGLRCQTEGHASTTREGGSRKKSKHSTTS